MKLEEGRVYRIDTSKSPYNGRCGMFDSFESYNGREISWLNIVEEREDCFYYDSWYFTKDVLVKVRGKRLERVIKEESRKYTDFKEGDLVRLRTIEDLRQHYYADDKYIYTTERLHIDDTGYVELIGKEAVINKIRSDKTVVLDFNNDKDGKSHYYTFCLEMLEIIEEGYVKRMEEELEAKRKNRDIDADNDEVVQEMLSKVDIETFEKILAGAFRTKASSLLGIDKLLKDWACAKREIYLALGRNLTIRKHIEYEMEDREVYERREQLANKFPRILQAFKRSIY